jgi:PKD repeat protein
MSGMWSNVGVIGAVGATGLTGVQNGTNVTLYITSGGTATPLNTLYAYYDTSGFGGTPEDDSRGNGALGIQLTQYPTILPGVANYQLINTRGIAMAPLGGEYPTQSGNWVTNAIANDISVGPPYPVVCTGNLGGPYYSTNVYSIANFGTNAFTVTANNVPGWLTSSFSGSTTIQPLGSITCQMVVNSGANSLTANQSGQFTFTTGFGAGNQSVNIGYVLNVNSLAVTPSSNCVAVGEPCGPFTFSPVNSNIYTLTNLTGLALQWGASISNNSPWVSLSSTGSLLAPFSSIAVTALVTAAANTYVIGTYHEIILLSNVSENTELDHDYFSLQVGYGFFDDFSTYAPGNVVDQGNWTASPADTNSPVQIAPFQGSGPLQYVVAGQTPGMMAQQPRKNFTGQIITNTAAYGILGMLITVTNGSSAQNSIFDFAAGLNGAGYYSCEAGMENSQGGYVWTLQLNQANTQATLGNTVWSFFTQYQVYIIGDEVNSNAWIFVNPTTSDLPTLLASSSYDIYIKWNNINCSTCGGDTTNFGSVVMGQYSSGTAQCPGYAVAKAAASTNYTDVYNFLNGNPPTAPVSASFTVNNSSGTAPLTVQFTDTSTGSPAPDEWFWTFDNVGDTSTSENPSFTYSTPGTYTVQLIAANNCNWSTSSVPITVTSPLTPFQSWQTYYYGSPSSPNAAGNLDPYGSGMSNTNKFLAGFSTNKLATLHIISIARANTTDIRVTYLGANGDNSYSGGPFSRTNILEYSSGTGKGSYTNSFQPTGQTNILGGGSGLGTVTNMTDFYGATNGPARFYRVRVLLP